MMKRRLICSERPQQSPVIRCLILRWTLRSWLRLFSPVFSCWRSSGSSPCSTDVSVDERVLRVVWRAGALAWVTSLNPFRKRRQAPPPVYPTGNSPEETKQWNECYWRINFQTNLRLTSIKSFVIDIIMINPTKICLLEQYFKIKVIYIYIYI